MILFFTTAPRVIKMKHFQTTVCRLSCQIDGLELPKINKLLSEKIRLIHVTDTRLCSSQLLLMFHFGSSYFTEDGHQPIKSWRQISDRSINGKKVNSWQFLLQGLFVCNIFTLLPFPTDYSPWAGFQPPLSKFAIDCDIGYKIKPPTEIRW